MPGFRNSGGFFAATAVHPDMQILVTGGAGFIGGHLAERFVRDGHDVAVLDNLDPFYDVRIKEHTIERCRELAADGDGSYRFVDGDVRDGDAVEPLVADADHVYHQAAQAGVRGSVENPRKYDAVNVDGTLNVLDAARESGIERVVVASSSSVYGVPRDLPYDEEHPTTPVSPYGASKLAAERYACAYSAVYDLPAVALRYFTVYGPRMRPNMAITNFVSRSIHGEPPVVYGDGSQTRDFTYIDDVVSANVELLETDAADGEAVNIGSTDNIAILTLAREVRDQLDPDLEVAFDERHAADAEHTHADVSKAGELLGYEPEYSIREGVAAFVAWYRENTDWYDPLVRAS
jgi:UDP-glucose 4-epimerase